MPAAGIRAVIEPSKPAIEGLTKHIKETLRAFPMADLAKMILNGRERYQVRFTAQEDRRLYRCPADGSVWLSREEAVSHFLNSPAIEKYYLAEDVEVGAPTGNFTVVAVCGLSGTILGPPNHHEYQRNIARLHQERFSHMSLERYKSRIGMESGEEVIERWKEQVSQVRHYRLKSDLVVPEVEVASAEPAPPEGDVEEVPTEGNEEVAEATEVSEAATAEVESEESPVAVEEVIASDESDSPAVDEVPSPSDVALADEAPAAEKPKTDGLVIKSIEELTRHFRQNYADKAVREVKEAIIPGDIPGKMLSPGLLAHLRQEGERLRRGFPLELIQKLCRDLEKKGLKFFKRGKKSLHVSAVRPKELDPAVTLTSQIQQIVDFVIATPKTTVTAMLEALVPDFKKPENTAGEAATEVIELSEDAKTALKHLRWLTSEGYVLEFPDTSLAIGRVPQKEAADKQAPKKKTSQKKNTVTAPAALPVAETSESTTTTTADELGSSDLPDPLVALDAPDQDPDDLDALPEDVNPVETF